MFIWDKSSDTVSLRYLVKNTPFRLKNTHFRPKNAHWRPKTTILDQKIPSCLKLQSWQNTFGFKNIIFDEKSDECSLNCKHGNFSVENRYFWSKKLPSTVSYIRVSSLEYHFHLNFPTRGSVQHIKEWIKAYFSLNSSIFFIYYMETGPLVAEILEWGCKGEVYGRRRTHKERKNITQLLSGQWTRATCLKKSLGMS